MRYLLFKFVVMATSTSIGLAQDFQKCVTSPTFHFINTKTFDTSLLDPIPPPDQKWLFGDDKIMADYELGDLYRLQNSRTAGEVKQANEDAGELDIFIFKGVMGDQFNALNPALAATVKLSQNLCEESTALAALQKKKFKRKRPFLVDPEIKPATDLTYLKDSPSYPSGHSLTGYLEALVLAEIVPEKRDAIMARALEFARERNLLGVHYLSDITAGRRVAYALFEEISKSPEFKGELAAARTEVRGHM